MTPTYALPDFDITHWYSLTNEISFAQGLFTNCRHPSVVTCVQMRRKQWLKTHCVVSRMVDGGLTHNVFDTIRPINLSINELTHIPFTQWMHFSADTSTNLKIMSLRSTNQSINQKHTGHVHVHPSQMVSFSGRKTFPAVAYDHTTTKQHQVKTERDGQKEKTFFIYYITY